MEEQVVTVNYKELPLSDDFMFGEVMRRPHICKLFLEALLEKPIARIEYITKQQDISESVSSHGIRLDVYLKDDRNTVYSIEMQTTVGTILFKRVRYYQSAIDRYNLQKGEHYSKLPESFIIMVCTADLFGRGLALYRRKFMMEDCPDVEYDDGSHLYILNTAYTTANVREPILEFLRCIQSNDIAPAEYHSQLMKEICPAIAEIRSDSGKEAEYMTWQTKLMDAEFIAEQRGLEKGVKQGMEQGIQALVCSLKGLYIDRETIVRQIAEQYKLPMQTAVSKVDQYWVR